MLLPASGGEGGGEGGAVLPTAAVHPAYDTNPHAS